MLVSSAGSCLAYFGLAGTYHFWYYKEHERIVKRLPAFVYELPSGHVPVRDWIRSLDTADRKIIEFT
jgi:hypothetical protein